MKKPIFVLSIFLLLSFCTVWIPSAAQAEPPSLFQAQIILKNVEIEGPLVKIELETGADPILLEMPLAEEVKNPDQRNNMRLTFSEIEFEITPTGSAAWNGGKIEDFSIAIDFLNPERNARVIVEENLNTLPTLGDSVVISVNDVEQPGSSGMIAMQIANSQEDSSVILTGAPGFWIENINPLGGADIPVLNPNDADLDKITEPKIILSNFFRYNDLPVQDFSEIETLKLKIGELRGEFTTGDNAAFKYNFFVGRELELIFAK